MERAILAPKNEELDDINKLLFHVDLKIYLNVGSMVDPNHSSGKGNIAHLHSPST